jgi:hypothetical protein
MWGIVRSRRELEGAKPHSSNSLGNSSHLEFDVEKCLSGAECEMVPVKFCV